MGLAGAVIGLTVGFFGWEVSGLICGALFGLIVLAFSIPSILDKEAGLWLTLYALPGGIVALALLNWLFCWYPLRIDSSGVLVWASWAIMPILALLGLMFTIAVWIQHRPARERRSRRCFGSWLPIPERLAQFLALYPPQSRLRSLIRSAPSPGWPHARGGVRRCRRAAMLAVRRRC